MGEGVRVGVAEGLGDAVLLLQQELVAPPGALVQLAADVEQHGVGLLHRGGRDVGDPGRGERAQYLHVAQAAPGRLQIGFEQEGDVTGHARAFLARLLQVGQPLAGAGPPLGQGALPQARRQVLVAGGVVHVEQSQRRAQVTGRDAQGLVDGPDAVVEADAGVPDRVPEPVGDRADVGRPPVVDEHEVEVAARRRLPAAVAAQGDQRDARAGVGGLEQTG